MARSTRKHQHDEARRAERHPQISPTCTRPAAYPAADNGAAGGTCATELPDGEQSVGRGRERSAPRRMRRSADHAGPAPECRIDQRREAVALDVDRPTCRQQGGKGEPERKGERMRAARADARYRSVVRNRLQVC
jgi:hypothetical protein